MKAEKEAIYDQSYLTQFYFNGFKNKKKFHTGELKVPKYRKCANYFYAVVGSYEHFKTYSLILHLSFLSDLF